MTRKRIAIILGGALVVMAAALVLAGVLHDFDGKARAQEPADKVVLDVVFDNADNYPLAGSELSPPNEFTILKSENVPFSVTSVEMNQGPGMPFDAEISFYAFVPQGCSGRWYDPQGAFPFDVQTIGGDPGVPSSGAVYFPPLKEPGPVWLDLHFQTMEYGIMEFPFEPLELTRFFEIHCYEGTDYTFTFCNRADVKPPDFDPLPENNLWCENLTVHSLHNADIEILSWTAPSPQSGEVGVPFEITAEEVKHNGGPQSAFSDVTWTAVEPPTGGEVSARWIAEPGDIQPSDEVLQFQVDLTAISTDLQLSRNLELTCNVAGGPYTVTLINEEWPIDPLPPHDPWEDPDPSDNIAYTNVLVNCAAAGDVKWLQEPDPTEMGIDVDATVPFVLADDFQCTESGMITEIDFWASWLYDEPPGMDPNAVIFTLSLHSDVPAGPTYSHPGDLLWVHTFGPGECVPQPFFYGPEGWLYPPMDYMFPTDFQMWFYSCPIPASDWFQQAEDTIYWLDIQATPLAEPARFGWKTSIQHWNDDAVWSMGAEPIDPLTWGELRYPPQHPYAGQSIDLAFQISGQPCTAGVDTDGDTFNDNVECYLPTDSRDNCPDVVGADDAWPLDVSMNKVITVVGDVLPYSGRMGSTGGPPPSANWRKRLDLNMDNFLTVVGDVLKFSGKIGSTCT